MSGFTEPGRGRDGDNSSLFSFGDGRCRSVNPWRERGVVWFGTRDSQYTDADYVMDEYGVLEGLFSDVFCADKIGHGFLSRRLCRAIPTSRHAS